VLEWLQDGLLCGSLAKGWGAGAALPSEGATSKSKAAGTPRGGKS